MIIMITMVHFVRSFLLKRAGHWGDWRVMGLACFPLNPVSPQVPFGVVSCRLQWERWHSSWLKHTNTAGQSSICLLCFCSRNKRWWDWREEKGRESARSPSEAGRWPVPECHASTRSSVSHPSVSSFRANVSFRNFSAFWYFLFTGSAGLKLVWRLNGQHLHKRYFQWVLCCMQVISEWSYLGNEWIFVLIWGLAK